MLQDMEPLWKSLAALKISVNHLTRTRRRWAPVPAEFEDSDHRAEWMTHDRVNVFFSLCCKEKRFLFSAELALEYWTGSHRQYCLLTCYRATRRPCKVSGRKTRTARLVSLKLPKNWLPAWLLLWIFYMDEFTDGRHVKITTGLLVLIKTAWFNENKRLIKINMWWRIDRPKYTFKIHLDFLFEGGWV